MKANFLIAAVVAALPSLSGAEVWPHNLGPALFGSVEVHVSDNAKDGCWTNLGESKTYAVDKLSNLGYEISEVEDNRGQFLISVTSERVVGGKCYGMISIQMYRSEVVDGLFGYLEVALSTMTFTGYDNANVMVLNQISDLAEQMKSQQN